MAPEKRACKWYECGTGKQGDLPLPGWRHRERGVKPPVFEGCRGMETRSHLISFQSRKLKALPEKTTRKKGLAFTGPVWKGLIRKRRSTSDLQ